MLYSDVFGALEKYIKCDWRHLVSYLLADNELKDFAYNRSESKLGSNALSWMFEARYVGVKHKPIYLVITDSKRDIRSGCLMFSSFVNTKILNSLIFSFDTYLKKKVQENKPIEYEIAFKYGCIGVGARESRENELWAYSREHKRRRYFESVVGDIESILI